MSANTNILSKEDVDDSNTIISRRLHLLELSKCDDGATKMGAYGLLFYAVRGRTHVMRDGKIMRPQLWYLYGETEDYECMTPCRGFKTAHAALKEGVRLQRRHLKEQLKLVSVVEKDLFWLCGNKK